MIVSNIQNVPKRNNYPCPNNNFSPINRTILKDEVSFGSKKLKPEEQGAEFINDGINDIGNIGSNPSKSDLNGAKDGLSMHLEFLKRETDALKQQDIDLREIDIPKIDIPDIPDLELQNLNFTDDIDNISKDIDKSFKSSMLKSILAELGVGLAVVGVIYYFLKKNKNNNNSLDKKV